MAKSQITAANVMKPFSALTTQAWMREVRQGLPTAAVRKFVKDSGLDPKALLRVLQISKRTLERKADAHLTPAQYDRFLRVKRIYDEGVDVLGDAQAAAGWLQDRNRMLEGERPLDILDTEVGAESVAIALNNIAGGLPA